MRNASTKAGHPQTWAAVQRPKIPSPIRELVYRHAWRSNRFPAHAGLILPKGTPSSNSGPFASATIRFCVLWAPEDGESGRRGPGTFVLFVAALIFKTFPIWARQPASENSYEAGAWRPRPCGWLIPIRAFFVLAAGSISWAGLFPIKGRLFAGRCWQSSFFFFFFRRICREDEPTHRKDMGTNIPRGASRSCPPVMMAAGCGLVAVLLLFPN